MHGAKNDADRPLPEDLVSSQDEVEGIESCTVQDSSHWPHVATDHLKCDQSKSRGAVRIKCMLGFGTERKKNVNISNVFMLIPCWVDDILAL